MPDMSGGGAERIALNLVKGFAGNRFAVDLVLVQAEGPLLAKLPKSVRLVDLNASRVLTSLPALVRYLRHEQPVVLFTALSYASIIALWARRLASVSTRVIVSQHSVPSYSAKHAPDQLGRLMPLLIRFFYPWADGIVAVSKVVANDLTQVAGIPRESIQVVYNPVVTPEVRSMANAPLVHPWFASGEPPVVLTAGRLAVEKDFPTLIQAFARVRQERSARLLILGEGYERPVLEAQIKRLGLQFDIALPGFVENPYAYMTRSSVFVLCSRWEALPTVLIEALYCGLPIIATDCPGGTREILSDGNYGLLVPVGDAFALARAIETSLVRKPQRPPDESWSPFEMEANVNKYIKILLESEYCVV